MIYDTYDFSHFKQIKFYSVKLSKIIRVTYSLNRQRKRYDYCVKNIYTYATEENITLTGSLVKKSMTEPVIRLKKDPSL